MTKAPTKTSAMDARKTMVAMIRTGLNICRGLEEGRGETRNYLFQLACKLSLIVRLCLRETGPLTPMRKPVPVSETRMPTVYRTGKGLRQDGHEGC